MKYKWNVDPFAQTTIARIIGELEGCSYLLDCMDEPEDFASIEEMKKKYYKKYFAMTKFKKSEQIAQPKVLNPTEVTE